MKTQNGKQTKPQRGQSKCSIKCVDLPAFQSQTAPSNKMDLDKMAIHCRPPTECELIPESRGRSRRLTTPQKIRIMVMASGHGSKVPR